MEEKYKAKVNERNKQNISKLNACLEKYNIIGIVDITSLPAPQFQRIRASLNGIVEILIIKKNLIEISLKKFESKFKGISKLIENLQGIVGVIFTNENPFKVFKKINKSKSNAPCKAGQIAPNEIWVKAGPTSFLPGPIIGELGAVGIKSGVNQGKIEIKEDSLVAKEGDEISAALAGILTRLGVEPMEVGLNIKAIYENGTIFKKDVLDVDENKIMSDLINNVKESFALSLGISYPTKENIDTLLFNSFKNSLAVSLKVEYPIEENIKELIKKSYILSASLNGVLPEDLKDKTINISAPKEVATGNAPDAKEEKQEEKKEEPKVEDAASGLSDLF